MENFIEIFALPEVRHYKVISSKIVRGEKVLIIYLQNGMFLAVTRFIPKGGISKDLSKYNVSLLRDGVVCAYYEAVEYLMLHSLLKSIIQDKANRH